MIPELSICITAYNQINFIKWNISNLLLSKCSNFEIVIQDDCSTENIKELVYSFNDKRIKYYRNISNLGHDSNILEGIKNCKSNYVFLLRSTDTLIVNGVEKIIRFINNNPGVGYCRFSCVDDFGKKRIIQKDFIAPKGIKSVELHSKLLIHPSGELYNKSYFAESDYKMFNYYLNKYFYDNRKFIVHVLMREKLSLSAGIASSKEIVWKYTYTNRRKDVAQNRSDNKISIYHPTYQYKRLQCELNYVERELNGNGKLELLREIINRYAKQIIFDYKFINRNKKMQKHYEYDTCTFSSCDEMKKFKVNVRTFIESLPSNDKKIMYDRLKKVNSITLVRWYAQKIVIYALRKLKCYRD